MRKSLKTIILVSAAAGTALAAQAPLESGEYTRAVIANDSLERARALHLLNRITYGPRPGDVDLVLSMGIDRFIQLQLNPDRIPEPELDGVLRGFPILHMPAEELARLNREMQMARRAQQQQNATDSAVAGDRRRQAAGRAQPNTMRRLMGGMQQAAVVRAALANRQLYEVMVDFWTNHFNVFMAKGADRYLTSDYIENTIRPNSMGSFEDLLIATATSPAMLFYLDNTSSVAVGAEAPQLAQMQRAIEQGQRRMNASRQASRFGGSRNRGAAGANAQTQRERLRNAEERMAQIRERMPKGINENYARELMELHTLGVDGGYTQHDVVEVARVLTGWGMEPPGRGGTDFEFHAWAHDFGEKTVMGETFPEGEGMEEGIRLLRLLANHPATMRHVSSKLCQRFVNDEPPAGCIEAGAIAWRRTGGEMTAVLNAIITSPDFWAEENRGAKTKTPLEFVVSSVRAVGGSPDTTLALAQVVRRLGQPLYLHSAPTGYPESQDEWVNSGALIERMNIALGFAAGRIPGANANLDEIAPVTDDVHELVATVNENVLGGAASANTLRVMTEQAESARNKREARMLAVGLALGSPEFQRQ